jgi:pilus assembly protein CpaB
VLAVLAVLLGIIALSQRGQQATVTPTPAGIPVVVAARDIPAGTVLTADDVQVERVAQGAAAAGVVQSPSQVIGLVTANALVKGQQITIVNLQSSGVSVALKPGKRAIALPVDRVTGVGGLVQPNDTIDIIYSGRLILTGLLPTSPLQSASDQKGFSPPQLTLPAPNQPTPAAYPFPGEPGSQVIISDGTNGAPVTKIVLQNIRVLQVLAGTQVVSAAASRPTVTTGTATPQPTPAGSTGGLSASVPAVDLLILEVDPQQAEVIAFLVAQQAHYQVVLRARNDQDTAKTTGITYDRLFTDYALPVPHSYRVPGGPQ